ncbi:MAG: phosphopantothenoylcysteine decarboxylase [Planctomycetes bacterium]|nr:phosphopantothenoylcysteine decarboxylase [Planctomycetota bacterium]
MAKILLAASASVALYKACDLASKLAQDGHAVRAILTKRAAELVNPQLFEAVTSEPAFVDEFGAARRSAMDHIDLAQWGELFLTAPASADLVARFAHGLADDLVTTTALALPTGTPKLVSPAMNPNMLAQPAVRRNLAQLAADGWLVIEPEVGHTACGDAGRGRLPEPATLVERVRAVLAKRR